RPQDVLRPPRPLAAARPGRLPAAGRPLLPPQVRAEHVRGVPPPSGGRMSSFADAYLSEASAILAAIDRTDVERLAEGLARVRDAGGRLFVIGVGGSAGHASHAVNDFRKLCGFEAYAPTDNVSELTARINDEGWDTSIAAWLRGSRLAAADAVLVFSVGGADRERNASPTTL